MAIELICTGCAHEMSLQDSLVGKKVRCPGCQQVVRVPQPAATHAGSPAPRPRPQAAAPSEAEPHVERPRYRRRKKSSPTLFIFIGCILAVAIAYPIVLGQRSKTLSREIEASHANARGVLDAGNAAQAEAILYKSITLLDDLDPLDREPLEFRIQSLYAEALLANQLTGKANAALGIAAAHVNTPDERAILEQLRARAHPDQADYQTVCGHYRAAIEARASPALIRQALEYALRVTEGRSTALANRRKEVAKDEYDAEHAESELVAKASRYGLPEKQETLRREIAEFDLLVSTVLELVKVARLTEPGLADNFEAMIQLARDQASAKAQ